MSTVRKVKSVGNKSKASAPKTKAASAAKKRAVDAQAKRSPLKSNAQESASKKKKLEAGPATVGKSHAGKIMRDTFRMPRADFDLLRALKARARALGQPCKKSDLLRAGLHALQRYDDAQLLQSLRA